MASIDPESGGLATPGCPKPVALPFLVGTEPREYCPIHGGGMFASGTTPNAIWGASGPPAAIAGAATAADQAASDVFSKVGSFFGSLFHR